MTTFIKQQKNLVKNLDHYLGTNYSQNYTPIQPSLFIDFWQAHGLAMGAGLALLLLVALLSSSLIAIGSGVAVGALIHHVSDTKLSPSLLLAAVTLTALLNAPAFTVGLLFGALSGVFIKELDKPDHAVSFLSWSKR